MRCALAVFLACLLLGLLSAQALPTSPTDSPPAASAAISPTPSDIAARLSSLSTMLSAELDGSQIDLAELKSSLEASRNALESCQASLAQAGAESRRRSLALGLWRVGALAGVGACLGSILYKGEPVALGLGALSGLAAGAAWWAVEAWPVRIKL